MLKQSWNFVEQLKQTKTNTFGFKPLDLIFLYSGKKTEIWEGICNEIPHQQKLFTNKEYHTKHVL